MNGAILRTKPKFIRLYTMLAISPVLARGLLEFLWDSVSDTGDPEIGDAAAVEAAAGWTGEPGKLCKALLQCGGRKAGFIEESPGSPGVFRLHDLLANSSDEQIRNWIRRQARAERGHTIAEIRAQVKPSRSAAIASHTRAATQTQPPQSVDNNPLLPTPQAPPSPLSVQPPVQNSVNPKATASHQGVRPDIPKLLEVKDLFARYGYKGKPADFLQQFATELARGKGPAHWKAAAVDWAHSQQASESDLEPVLAVSG